MRDVTKKRNVKSSEKRARQFIANDLNKVRSLGDEVRHRSLGAFLIKRDIELHEDSKLEDFMERNRKRILSHIILPIIGSTEGFDTIRAIELNGDDFDIANVQKSTQKHCKSPIIDAKFGVPTITGAPYGAPGQRFVSLGVDSETYKQIQMEHGSITADILPSRIMPARVPRIALVATSDQQEATQLLDELREANPVGELFDLSPGIAVPLSYPARQFRR